MNRKKLLAAACLAALTTLGLPADKVTAQSSDKDDGSVEVGEDKDSGKSPNKNDRSIGMVTRDDKGREKLRRSHDGVMEPVGLATGQGVTITLATGEEKAGAPVIVNLLDGGAIIAPRNLTVGRDGKVGFSFHAGDTPGLYRVQVTLGAEQYELQLYAVKAQATN